MHERALTEKRAHEKVKKNWEEYMGWFKGEERKGRNVIVL